MAGERRVEPEEVLAWLGGPEGEGVRYSETRRAELVRRGEAWLVEMLLRTGMSTLGVDRYVREVLGRYRIEFTLSDVRVVQLDASDDERKEST